MPGRELRIGIVGAGQVARQRHVPGFRALPGVRIVGVSTRRRASASRAAREFDIPRIYETWEHLVDDDAIDAVVIATWPYLHCAITLAALEAGKHVLTQSSMAMNAREAQRMLDAARARPDLTAMVAPSPFGLTGDAFIGRLIADGYLGDLRELHVHGLSDSLANRSTPIGWRQVARYAGFNMLDLGPLHEAALRWSAPPVRVLARAARMVPHRRDPETRRAVKVGTPDSVQALTTQQDGSLGVYRLSGVVRHENTSAIALYGAEGTLIYDLARDRIVGGREGESSLRLLTVPPELRGGWRAEAEFVAAIRGEGPVTRTDFLTAARVMHFIEGVARSSRLEQPLEIPLKEYSNPGT